MDWNTQLDRNGYYLFKRVYSVDSVRDVRKRLQDCLQSLPPSSASVRSQGGSIYALRNFLELFPYATEVWKQSPLPDVLLQALGEDAGLVRGLFFDKPPERTWSLPWHKDLTIAVRDNSIQSSLFRNPTCKAGVAHIEAPRSLLESMLTLRIHLDDAKEENGALRVIPGSHRQGKTKIQDADVGTLVTATAGDVLVMRPLLSHCSGNSNPNTRRQRRVLHLEFATRQQLPDGFYWHYFQPLTIDPK